MTTNVINYFKSNFNFDLNIPLEVSTTISERWQQPKNVIKYTEKETKNMSIFAKNAKNIFMKTSFTDKKENTYDSSKSDWYRNKTSQNIIRMLPLREDGQPSFIQTVNHFFLKMKSESGAIATVAPVCLDFLFREDGNDE